MFVPWDIFWIMERDDERVVLGGVESEFHMMVEVSAGASSILWKANIELS